jgi:hypothetical protein
MDGSAGRKRVPESVDLDLTAVEDLREHTPSGRADAADVSTDPASPTAGVGPFGVRLLDVRVLGVRVPGARLLGAGIRKLDGIAPAAATVWVMAGVATTIFGWVAACLWAGMPATVTALTTAGITFLLGTVAVLLQTDSAARRHRRREIEARRARRPLRRVGGLRTRIKGRGTPRNGSGPSRSC